MTLGIKSDLKIWGYLKKVKWSLKRSGKFKFVSTEFGYRHIREIWDIHCPTIIRL